MLFRFLWNFLIKRWVCYNNGLRKRILGRQRLFGSSFFRSFHYGWMDGCGCEILWHCSTQTFVLCREVDLFCEWNAKIWSLPKNKQNKQSGINSLSNNETQFNTILNQMIIKSFTIEFFFMPMFSIDLERCCCCLKATVGNVKRFLTWLFRVMIGFYLFSYFWKLLFFSKYMNNVFAWKILQNLFFLFFYEFILIFLIFLFGMLLLLHENIHFFFYISQFLEIVAFIYFKYSLSRFLKNKFKL